MARAPLLPLVAMALIPPALTGCGKTGPLYLPETAGEVVTRPAATPPPETSGSSNSPQSVDSPPAPPSPAPEVTEPDAEPAKDRKKDAAGTSPR
jgi:predicted small lipoprotein YifL